MPCSATLAALVIVFGLCLNAPASAATTIRHLAQTSNASAASSSSSNGPATIHATATSPVYPSNCTPPRTLEDTRKPFCFAPQTASPLVQQFLLTNAAGAVDFTSAGGSQLQALQYARNWYRNVSTPGSDAAVAAFLQGTRNDTIAGVPVVFGTPKGVSSSSNPADAKLLIYLHGGGHIIGSCYFQWSTVAPTAARAGLPILCVEYRLAPEHPFPADINDALAVYKALLKQGYQAKNIVLLGDSAGGQMVAALTIQLQRQGLPLPAALGMFSPAAEWNTTLDSRETMIAVDPVLNSATLDQMGNAYVGGNVSLYADPLVAPRRADFATIFAGGKLPPTLIQVGLREELLSDAVLLYHKMKQAAPQRVFISPYDAVWHVFQSYFITPEAEAAHQEMADFFTRSLNGTLCSS